MTTEEEIHLSSSNCCSTTSTESDQRAVLNPLPLGTTMAAVTNLDEVTHSIMMVQQQQQQSTEMVAAEEEVHCSREKNTVTNIYPDVTTFDTHFEVSTDAVATTIVDCAIAVAASSTHDESYVMTTTDNSFSSSSSITVTTTGVTTDNEPSVPAVSIHQHQQQQRTSMLLVPQQISSSSRPHSQSHNQLLLLPPSSCNNLRKSKSLQDIIPNANNSGGAELSSDINIGIIASYVDYDSDGDSKQQQKRKRRRTIKGFKRKITDFLEHHTWIAGPLNLNNVHI